MFRRCFVIGTTVVVAAVAVVVASVGVAAAPPVGQLPAGPSSKIETRTGELIAFALPHRAGGRVWRVARAFDGRVVREVTEADVGKQVVLVFTATGRGTTIVSFGLTRGDRIKAYEARRFTVTVR